MKAFLKNLFLGLVVLPMTLVFPMLSSGHTPLNDGEGKKEKSNFSDPKLSIEAEASMMDFIITASSASVAQNDEVCVQFAVSNFTNILGMEFLVNYDPALLQFSDIQNLNLAGLANSSFGRPGEGANPPGQLKVSWFDQNVAGVTVADATVIFEVCFTVISNDATATVSFSNPEIIDVDENILNFSPQTGTITIGTGGDGGGNTGGNTGDFTISISDQTAMQGAEVCVEVGVENFTDILGVELLFNYDPTKLQYSSVKSLNLAGLNQSAFGTPGVGANPLGQLKLSWFDQAVSGVSVNDGTVIFEICFIALVEGAHNVSMSNSEIIDIDENILNFSGQPGVVTVGDGGNTGGNTGDFTITVSDENVLQGEEVCVEVSVDGFTDILGVEVVFNYDPTKLQFNAVQSLNLEGLNQSAFGLPGVGANPDGQLKLSWFDQAVSGVSVADGTVIFEICFTALASTGTDDITMSNAEIIDSNENTIGFTGNSGTVTIGNNGNTGNENDFTFNISDETAMQGEEVCVEVSVENFTDILGVELVFNFDPSKLQFTEIKNLNLDGLNQSAFGLPGVGANPNNQIKLSWFDQAVSGITVADATVIFEICFTALASSGTDDVTMSDAEIIDINENILPFNGSPGTVTFGGGNGNSGFQLIATDATVEANETFCVDINVNGFTNLAGAEFSLSYDPALLTFTEVKNFNLVDLNENAFGVPGVGNNQPGAIKVSWVDAGASGVTVADGTTIFQACFQAGNNGGTTDIDFTGIEIIDQNDMLVSAAKQPGTITIESDNVGNGDLSFEIGSATVEAGEDICVPFTVNNFNDLVGIEFSINYDPSKLEFIEVKDFNLQDLGASAFGVPGVGNNQPGAIKLSWLDQSITGVDVPNGTQIFMLCFKTIGSGSTIVSISETGLEVTDVNENLVDPVTQAGTINITGIAPTTALQFIFSNESAREDEEVCVQVTANNFDNVLGMEYTMSYDPAILEFKSIGNINLDQLTEASFGVPGVGINPPGEVKVSWFDQNVQGISVPDGTVLFELCFTAIVESGSTTVDIDRSKDVEIIDSDEELIVNQSVFGTVTISSFPPLALSGPATITDSDCFDSPNGEIQVSISGGTGTYTYAWSFDNASTQNLTNVPPGTYMLTVTDVNSNQILTESFTVGGPATGITVDNSMLTDVNCFGESTGSILINASGGTGVLSFAWSDNLAATNNPTGLAAGTYDLTITDENSCTNTFSYTINEPASAIDVQSASTPVTCDGLDDGTISLTVSGGTGPYTYSWGNGLSGDVADQDNLAADDYPVTVTDDNGCMATTTVTVASNPAVEISNVQVGFIDDGADGAVSIDVAGGTSPYSYSWTGPAGFTSTATDIANLATVGEYCVTVTDDNGCTSSTCVMVLETLSFANIDILNTCSGASTGVINLEINGGMAPYTYSWDNGATSEDISDLADGNYNLTVTDALGNTFNGQFPVGSFNPIFISADVTNVEGGEGLTNGAIDLNASGGNPGFTYMWNTGATTPDLNNIGSGEYCVTVTDQNGCTAEACFDVEVNFLPLVFNTDKIDIQCNGASNGSIIVSISGGLAPYAVSFDDDVNMSTNDGVVSRDNLAAGEYRFVITDANNMTTQGSILLEEAAAVVLESVQIRHDGDAPGCTGEITIGVSGGTPGYTVQWNSPNTGFQIIGLCEGNYVPTIIDSRGCITELDPIFLNTFFIEDEITEAECREDETGVVVVTPNGGSGTYTYRWEDASGQLISETDRIENVPAGTYNVTVTESSGNTITKSYVVGTKSLLSATANVTSDYNGFGVSCADATDAILSATASNGEGNYIYTWMSGESIVGEGATINNIGPGNYTLEVTDGIGCTVKEELQVLAPSPISASGFITDVSCVGNRDGGVTVVAAGGVGSYNYRWSNNANTPNLTLLASGQYMLTVSDDNNCESVNSFDIGEPDAIQVTIEAIPADDGCNGIARAVVSGGTGPFTYRWSTNSTNTDSLLTDLCPGNYAVAVADSKGCTPLQELAVAEVLDRRFPCMDIRPVISPDGDGLNEDFVINCIEELNNNRISIYNRWGILVFETTNYQNDWNGGSAEGKLLPNGAYYYVLEFTDDEGNVVQNRGSITLLREE